MKMDPILNEKQDARDGQAQPTAEPLDTETSFYCDMLALSPAQRTAHQRNSAQLFGSLVQETRELPDGYAFRFDGVHYQLVADFIANERLCCPFLTFGLTVAAQRGPVWLQLTAKGDVKPFLQEELRPFVAER
jgi:hypothetical protein